MYNFSIKLEQDVLHEDSFNVILNSDNDILTAIDETVESIVRRNVSIIPLSLYREQLKLKVTELFETLYIKRNSEARLLWTGDAVSYLFDFDKKFITIKVYLFVSIKSINSKELQDEIKDIELRFKRLHEYFTSKNKDNGLIVS